MYILSRQRARTQQKKRAKQSIERYERLHPMNTPWNRTYFEEKRKEKNERQAGKAKIPERESKEQKTNVCMHNKNESIACDLCVHECDSKIMMYNFNIRTNIAQQEKN